MYTYYQLTGQRLIRYDDYKHDASSLGTPTTTLVYSPHLTHMHDTQPDPPWINTRPRPRPHAGHPLITIAGRGDLEDRAVPDNLYKMEGAIDGKVRVCGLVCGFGVGVAAWMTRVSICTHQIDDQTNETRASTTPHSILIS